MKNSIVSAALKSISRITARALAQRSLTAVSVLVAVVLTTGCASTKVTNQERTNYERLPRPGKIVVYDFAATAADVPANSSMSGLYGAHEVPQSAEDIAEGRKVGAAIAAALVDEIRRTGMSANLAAAGATPAINDIVIRGYLVAVTEGSATKRVAIGFGAGASELTTAVEGLQMTAQGLRKIGSGAVKSGGSKTPGAAMGVATFAATANPAGLIVSTGMKVYGEASGKSTVEGRAKDTAKEIGAVLKTRFKEQGWIY